MRRVNACIRKGGEFNKVLDFGAVVRNPEMLDMLNPIYNSGNYLQPNVLGY